MPPLPPSFAADSEQPPGPRFLILFEKLRAGITKNLFTETDSVLRALTENITKNYGIGDDATIPKILKQIVLYFSTLLSPMEYSRSKELAKILISFLTKVAEFDDVRCVLRDENGLLKFLTPIISDETNDEEHDTLMVLIEILARDMTLSWKVPYMINLIHHCVDMLLKVQNGLPTILQFLINVCKKNHCCVLILRGYANYKPALKVLKSQFVTSTDVRVDILVSHLHYLAEVSMPLHSFLSTHEFSNIAMAEALDSTDSQDDERFCQLMEAVRPILETICEKMKFNVVDSPGAFNGSNEYSDSISSAKNTFLELFTTFQENINTFVGKELDNLSQKAQENILSMMLTCLIPYNATTSSDTTLLRNCNAAATTACQILSSITSDKADSMMLIRYRAFGVILRISELIFESKDPSLVKAMDFFTRLKSVLKSGSLYTRAPMIGIKLDMNIVLVRLYGTLLFDSQMKEIIKRQLAGRVVEELFQNTLLDTLDRKQSYRQSVFAVELLTLLCRFTETPEISHMLLEQLAIPEVVNHISNCIRNGNEKEIAKALYLISSVTFNRSSVWATAKSLKQAQDQVINLQETPADMFSPFANSWSSSPRSDVEIMDYVADNQKDPTTSAMTEIVSLSQLRREVHEHEISMLNSHIFQLNKTILNLNILLKKQSDFVAKHISENEARDLEVSTLQHRHDKAVKESAEKLQVLTSESVRLKEQNADLVENTKAQSDKIKNFEKQVVDLQARQASLEEKTTSLTQSLKQSKEDKQSLREELKKAKSESDTASSKIKAIEKNLKQKNTDYEQLQQAMEKKQKMIDAIQGILGKNFPNFDM